MADLDLASDGFGFWLAGLIDGEGSFSIAPNRPGFLCRMNLGLRSDDSPILETIVQRTGIGSLWIARKRSQADGTNRKPLTLWRVQKKAECATLVEILDRYPLRSKKARDYAIWRIAVLRMAAMTGRVGTGHPQDWTGFAELKRELSNVRLFPEQPGVEGPARPGNREGRGSV